MIDGVLDDPVWREAPIDGRFFSEESKPYGQPSTVPTSVQVAYDHENLYVSFRCQYPEDPASDAVPLGAETDLIEYVGVYLDARHDHWSAKTFTLSPRGYRADFEAWQNGNERNTHWTGAWDGASHRFAGGWTAEFALPWGTIGVRPEHDDFEIGLNFRRYFNPGHVVWSPPPPGSPRPRPSFYGHLSGLRDIAPGQTILLVPYIAVGYTPGLPSYRYDLEDPVLSDFDRDLTSLAPYGGLFARLSVGKLRTDIVVNPDFSQVTPDAALANLDNYQLRFPEVRNFFVDATPVFRFGPDQFQLFYTRRLGLRQRTRRFDEIPIPVAANATYLQRGTSVALMHVLTSGLDGPIENGVDTTVDESHATIFRARQTFGPTNVGVLAMNQTRPFSPSAYRAYGVDGALSLYENHLTLNGFAARSDKLVQFHRLGVAGRESKRRDYEGYADHAWQTAATWKSEAFEAGVSYIDVGDEFYADLGYFERTGIRRTQVFAEYIAQIHSDLVRTRDAGSEPDRDLLQRPGALLPLPGRLPRSREALLREAQDQPVCHRPAAGRGRPERDRHRRRRYAHLACLLRRTPHRGDAGRLPDVPGLGLAGHRAAAGPQRAGQLRRGERVRMGPARLHGRRQRAARLVRGPSSCSSTSSSTSDRRWSTSTSR